MTNSHVDTLQRKAARVAGFMFLFILTDVMLNWVLFSKFIVPKNVMATATNIINNELLFRVGIANELILAVCAVVLAISLYIMLKMVNRNLALLALFWKLAEGIIMAVIALLNYIVLQILNGKASLTVFEPEHLHALVGFFINMHDTLYSIPMVFLGLNLTLFSYLFYKSKYIPRMIAGLGILSYTLVFIFAFVNILTPSFPGMILVVPSIFFELIIGIWLLFKDLKTPKISGEVSN
ncbi:DUF4386 domain-containing protein [Candidatus Latescibacterota bacterium]